MFGEYIDGPCAKTLQAELAFRVGCGGQRLWGIARVEHLDASQSIPGRIHSLSFDDAAGADKDNITEVVRLTGHARNLGCLVLVVSFGLHMHGVLVAWPQAEELEMPRILGSTGRQLKADGASRDAPIRPEPQLSAPDWLARIVHEPST